MDRLWARYDYEGLLKRRWRAIQEGRKAAARLDDLFQRDERYYNNNNNSVLAERDETTYLQHLWWSSDRLRAEIAAAAVETGEDSVWRRRGAQLPPESRHWLNHVQLTATQNNNVVGFVEVAMLVNPCTTTTATKTISIAREVEVPAQQYHYHHQEESCRIAVATARDNNQIDYHYYSPAITNLAVAPGVRRQGVGHRLLASAEAYVARNWKATTLGLYVQQENVAARALYDKRGYQPQMSLHDERLGQLWYRSKVLKKETSNNMPRRRNADAMESAKALVSSSPT